MMKEDGCKKVAIANDKETTARAWPSIVELQAKDDGVNVDRQRAASTRRRRTTARSRRRSRPTGADCFLFSGVTANGAVQLYKDVGAALPNAKLYGPDGVCESGFTNPTKKGIPKALGAALHSARSRRSNLKAYPGRPEVLRRTTRPSTATPSPDPYAIYGYEAMKLGLDTIKGLGRQGQRQAGRPRRSVRDQGPQVGPRHVLVRQERRHDADRLRHLQGRRRRQPDVRQGGQGAG